jgi:hypothetical protein
MTVPDSGHQTQEVRPKVSHQRPFPMRAPWPSQIPWWVMFGGVLLGWGIGYSPHLFMAMAVMCLLLGFLSGSAPGRGGEPRPGVRGHWR